MPFVSQIDISESIDKKQKRRNQKRGRMREDRPPSLASVAEKFGILTMKARKILITAGCYTSTRADEIKLYHDRGMAVEEIAAHTGYSTSVINSFLPYEKGMYGSDGVLMEKRLLGLLLSWHWNVICLYKKIVVMSKSRKQPDKLVHKQ